MDHVLWKYTAIVVVLALWGLVSSWRRMFRLAHTPYPSPPEVPQVYGPQDGAHLVVDDPAENYAAIVADLEDVEAQMREVAELYLIPEEAWR